MFIRELSFPSSNDRDQVKAWAYLPAGKPKGIIHLIHGFCEHSKRYLSMINGLVNAGFCVYADDHIGHGRTGIYNKNLGNPHSGHFLTYVHDEKKLHDIAVANHPKTPYIIFSHSWGSMLARCYAILYGNDVHAIILSGVCSQMHSLDNALTDIDFHKDYETNPYQNAGKWSSVVFQNMTIRYGNKADPMAWLAKDQTVINEHNMDPFIVRSHTLEMLHDLAEAYKFTESSEWAARVPQHIHFCFLGGDEDPCGNYGEGVYHVANNLVKTGHSAEVHLYSGFRHEAYHDSEIKEQFLQDMIRFLGKYF